MVVCVGADDLGLPTQGYTTFDEGFFEKFEVLEVAVGYPLVS
jgi:hypothetical protein